MSGSISISKKYGANPSMYCCFWCGEPKGVALLGRLKGDAKAPDRVIADYEPCDKCKSMFDKGIHVIGVSTTPIMKDMPSIGTSPDGSPLYPDGTYFVAREEYIRHIYEDNEEAINNVLTQRKLLMPSELVRKVVEYNNQEDHEDESSESGVSDSEPPDSDETH